MPQIPCSNCLLVVLLRFRNRFLVTADGYKLTGSGQCCNATSALSLSVLQQTLLQQAAMAIKFGPPIWICRQRKGTLSSHGHILILGEPLCPHFWNFSASFLHICLIWQKPSTRQLDVLLLYQQLRLEEDALAFELPTSRGISTIYRKLFSHVNNANTFG